MNTIAYDCTVYVKVSTEDLENALAEAERTLKKAGIDFGFMSAVLLNQDGNEIARCE